MKTRVKVRHVFSVICLLVLFAAMGIGEAAAATYYASPAGSGTSCLSGSPCSLATGMGKLVAGNTLLLKDGTYYSGITVGVSGSSGNPVTIKAENDGGAIVDGQGSRVPLDIAGRSYVDVEGIVFKNSSSDVIRVRSSSSHINLRRLSGINTGKGNYLVFLVSNSSYVLVEDCFGTNYGGSGNVYGGNGRHLFELYNGATNCTLRRNFGRYYQHNGGGGDAGDGIVLYGSGSGNVIENNVMDFSVARLGTGIYSFKPLSTNTTGGASTNASWYGNVVIGGQYVSVMAGFGATATSPQSQSGYIWKGNVFIGNGSQDGIDQYSSYNSRIENNTIVSTNTASGMGVISVYTSVSGYPSTASVKNNSLINDTVGLRCYGTGASTASRYNNFYDISTIYSGSTITDKTGDKALNLGYDTATYGNGAYLMVPLSLQGQGEGGADVGGEVLYQYQDAAPTDVPLWPWPMEDRIFHEIGVGVTWEANGGIWRTLDGVYVNSPVAPPPTVIPVASDTIAPSAPAGLTAAAVSSSQINLAWTPSTDNVGVAGYKVYRNGTQLATTTGTSYSNTGLASSTAYTYAVSAIDAAGNQSTKSPQVSATTKSRKRGGV